MPKRANLIGTCLEFNVAGELQRKIGRKVLDMGGNAVLGYRQEFDLEGDSMVARGIGTVAILYSLQEAELRLKYGPSSVAMSNSNALITRSASSAAVRVVNVDLVNE